MERTLLTKESHVSLQEGAEGIMEKKERDGRRWRRGRWGVLGRRPEGETEEDKDGGLNVEGIGVERLQSG